MRATSESFLGQPTHLGCHKPAPPYCALLFEPTSWHLQAERPKSSEVKFPCGAPYADHFHQDLNYNHQSKWHLEKHGACHMYIDQPPCPQFLGLRKKVCAWSLNLELTGLRAPPFPTRGSPSATNSATNSLSRQRRQAFPPALEPDLALLPWAEALPCNADPVCPARRTWHMKTVVYRMSITALPHTSSVLGVTLRNRGQVHFSLPLCCHDGIPKTRA
jgi:hypothetical protein